MRWSPTLKNIHTIQNEEDHSKSPLKNGYNYQYKKRTAAAIDEENLRFAKSILSQKPRVEPRA